MSEFKQEIDCGEDVDKLLVKARIAALEHDYVIQCVTSLSTLAGGKSLLNNTIAMMNKAEVATTAIHTGLWLFVCKVLKGEALA